MNPVLRSPKALQFHVVISQDEDGVYSAVAVNLPGTGSCGDTIEEALANFEEAAQAVVASYYDVDTIPWQDTAESESLYGVENKWITIYA